MQSSWVRPAVATIIVVAATLGGCARPTIEVTSPRADGRFLADSPLLFRVVDGRSKYTALAGPLDAERGVKAYIHQSTVTCGVTVGWVYIFGQYPVAETPLVHAGATGTTMIVANYPSHSRVVFLCSDHGERVVVTAKKPVVSGGKARTMQDQWYYLDAWPQNKPARVKFSPIKPVPHAGEADPEGARALVERVKQSVDAASLGGWCPQP
jgi:hypothetical protein